MMIQTKKKLASILFVLISFACTAQGGPPTLPPPGPPPPPPGLPIDSGVLLILVLGILYGAIQLVKKRKYNN